MKLRTATILDINTKKGPSGLVRINVVNRVIIFMIRLMSRTIMRRSICVVLMSSLDRCKTLKSLRDIMVIRCRRTLDT